MKREPKRHEKFALVIVLLGTLLTVDGAVKCGRYYQFVVNTAV